MDNHYHILIETAEGNLSLGMRQLNGVYTQRSNRRHNRVGHVFQGRYKAILVQRDDYLLELARYVVLNPVRAGMVKGPRDWPWSSYGSMIGKTSPPGWLETDWLLACFCKQRNLAIAKYIEFVKGGIGLPSIWERLKYQMYLGSDDFVESMRHKLDLSSKEDLSEISRLQRRPMAKSLQWYKDNTTDRKQAMALAYASGEYTMKEIAESFCVHYSTVSRAVKWFETNA